MEIELGEIKDKTTTLLKLMIKLPLTSAAENVNLSNLPKITKEACRRARNIILNM